MHAQPKKYWSKLLSPIVAHFEVLVVFYLVSALYLLPIGLGCIEMNPRFIRFYESTQKFSYIAIKQFSRVFWINDSMLFWSGVKKSDTHLAHRFFNLQICALFWHGYPTVIIHQSTVDFLNVLISSHFSWTPWMLSIFSACATTFTLVYTKRKQLFSMTEMFANLCWICVWFLGISCFSNIDTWPLHEFNFFPFFKSSEVVQITVTHILVSKMNRICLTAIKLISVYEGIQFRKLLSPCCTEELTVSRLYRH